MADVSRLLLELEGLDTRPAEEALEQALDHSLTGSGSAELASAAAVAWQSLQAGTAWEALVGWADDRLTHWHSLKINAVESAWAADPSGGDIETMTQAVLQSLRQGLSQQPEMLPDAHLLQAMARLDPPHSFAFTQVLRDLRADTSSPLMQAAPPLPEADTELLRHLQVVGRAFRFLID